MKSEEKHKLEQLSQIYSKLDINSLIELNGVIEQGQRNLGEKIEIIIITTHSHIAKNFLKQTIGLECNDSFRLNNCDLQIYNSVSPQYKLTIDNETILVTENNFIKSLSNKNTTGQTQIANGFINQNNLKYDNIILNFLYVKDFSDVTYYDWVSKLTGSDYAFYLLDGLQAFNAKEKDFFNNLLSKVFSYDRLSFIIGNIEFLDEKEFNEIKDYVHIFVEDKAKIEYLLTTYNNSSFVNRLQGIDKDTLQLRKKTKEDLISFSIAELLSILPDYKDSLKGNIGNIDKSINLLTNNNEIVTSSLTKINRKIESYFKEYALNLYFRRIDEFNAEFIKSVCRDIDVSEKIDEDSKYLNKYMDFVWSKFMENQNPWLRDKVLEEATQIESIINNDLLEIVGQLDSHSQSIIAEYLSQKYDPKSFIIEKSKKTGVEELTKCLNIGSVVLFIFNPIAGLLTLGGSQLIKKLFKDSIHSDRKDQLEQAVSRMSDNLKEQVAKQATLQFDMIVSKMKEQTEIMYNNVLKELFDLLINQRNKLENSTEILSYLNEVEEQIIPTFKS